MRNHHVKAATHREHVVLLLKPLHIPCTCRVVLKQIQGSLSHCSHCIHMGVPSIILTQTSHMFH